jgi:ribosomal protein S27E
MVFEALKTMTITCRKCQYEQITSFPQIEDKVTCPYCGLHGHMTISNSQIIEHGKMRIFIPQD